MAKKDLKNPPAQGEDLMKTASALLREGEREKARDLFKQVLQRAPRHVGLLNMLANVSYLLGEEAVAKDYLTRALNSLKISFEQSSAWGRPQYCMGMATVNLALGNIEEAERITKKLTFVLKPFRDEFGAFRTKRAASQERKLPGILINTLPKSASESIWNRLADGLGMPQAHVSIGFFPRCTLIGGRVEDLGMGGFTAKEHIPATVHNLGLLAQHGVNKIVFHHRDLRQAALSWAHFLVDDIAKRPMGAIWRDIVPPAQTLFGPFEELVDWCIDHYLPMIARFVAEWVEVADRGEGALKVLFLDFETFNRDAGGYFAKVLDFYEIPRQAFQEAQAQAADDGHFRKGESEEWRKVFTAEQKKRAWAAIPSKLSDRFGWTE